MVEANDAVSTAYREHFSTIAEIGRETSSGEIKDAVARLEETITIEDFNLVRARSSC